LGVIAVALVAGAAWSWSRTGDDPRDRPATAYEPPATPPNFLIFVADDLGVDKLASYQPPARPPATPTLDTLAKSGVIFDRAYSNPSCSPTRVTLLTGRDVRHFGVGKAIAANYAAGALPLTALTFAELFERGTGDAYAMEMIGKWHVAGDIEDRLNNPMAQGFDRFTGTMGNLTDDGSKTKGNQSYWNWERVEDGKLSRSEVYVTTANVQDAVAAIERMPEPWLLYVNFTAPHQPFHRPPKDMVHRPLPPEASPRQEYDAMVESVDIAVRDIVRSVGKESLEHTYTIFLGDNGTPGSAIAPPGNSDRGKLTLYEGGIHIPLLVAGPGIEGGQRTDVLVHTTDLFPTLAELAGMTLDPRLAEHLDGQSFAYALRDPDAESRRSYVYTERFEPLGKGPYNTYSRTIVGQRWKLIRHDHTGREELYDLSKKEGQSLLMKGAGPRALEARAYLAGLMDDVSGPIGSTVRPEARAAR
jgi:arylsulfatase A-like enzyme